MKFSARQKADCADRELKYRQRVYARKIAEGKMDSQLARIQIALMTEIRDEYAERAEAEEQKERLL